MNNPISLTYNTDCIQFMRQFPSKFFRVGLADPPYGIKAEQGTNRASRKQFAQEEMGSWDAGIPSEEYFYEFDRVCIERVLWGGNYFLHHLGPCKNFFVWDKLNPDRCFGDCEMAWSSFDEVPRVFKEKRVQELNKYDGGKVHPTQKPVALYHWQMMHIIKYIRKSHAGRINLLDTHLGSQNSRKAAHLLDIDFYGTELAPHHFQSGEDNFNWYKSKYVLLEQFSNQQDFVL